jgi:peptidase YpeB-like protein
MEVAMRILPAALTLMLLASPTLARDRPATKDEQAKVVAAVKAEGCSGGTIQFDVDDNEFEVDNAKCADGKVYDLDFDPSFKLIKKDPED